MLGTYISLSLPDFPMTSPVNSDLKTPILFLNPVAH